MVDNRIPTPEEIEKAIEKAKFIYQQTIVYQEAVQRVAQYIRENGPTRPKFAFDAFSASSVLAVAFEKTTGEVIKDILKINLKG